MAIIQVAIIKSKSKIINISVGKVTNKFIFDIKYSQGER